MSLILRSVKGSKLTIPEMDGNLLWVNNLTEVTFSEIQTLILNSELVPGQYYMIMDYRTGWEVPDYDSNKNSITPTGISQGPIEPIIVLAVDVNGTSIDAYQPAYPKDSIKYDITYTTTPNGFPVKGRITERIDEFNNRTDYDHRNITFKRYWLVYHNKETQLFSPTATVDLGGSGLVTGTGTTFTSLSSGNYVAIPGTYPMYFKIDTISDDTTMQVLGLVINPTIGSPIYLANVGSYDSYYQSNAHPADDFIEYLTFESGITAYNNYIGDHSQPFLIDGQGEFLLANNVFKDGDIENNVFGNSCYNNTFNDDCDSNRIGDFFYNNITNDDFDDNVIGSGFQDNVITSNFQYNQIGTNFQDNTLLEGSFYRNRIGNDFINNWKDDDYGGDFQNNVIGNQFSSNIIYNDFYENQIGNEYNQNDIYADFHGNRIGNAFNNNNIYVGDFTDNTIGERFQNNPSIGDFISGLRMGSFRDNQIGNRFKDNDVIGLQFFDNQIGNEFQENTSIGAPFANNRIGHQFQYNIIGDGFGYDGGNPAGNIIGNLFNGNTIGETFINNSIVDNFFNNTVVDDFQRNRIDTQISTLDFSFATHVYSTYNCTIAEGVSGPYLSYLDNSGTPSVIYATPLS